MNSIHSILTDAFPQHFDRHRLLTLTEPLQGLPTFPQPFPAVVIPPDVDGLNLAPKNIYKLLCCAVHSLPEQVLKTPWHNNATVQPSTRVNWKEIYSPLISKREAGIQYRLLHNIQVLHHINHITPKECGWCGERGTCTHMFVDCPSIRPALLLLHRLLKSILPNVNMNFEHYWCLVPHAGGWGKSTFASPTTS